MLKKAYAFYLCCSTLDHNDDIKIANKSLDYVAEFTYWYIGKKLTNLNCLPE